LNLIHLMLSAGMFERQEDRPWVFSIVSMLYLGSCTMFTSYMLLENGNLVADSLAKQALHREEDYEFI